MHNTTEPRPTGYLNVYEYDVSTDMFEIKAGDALSISWCTNEGEPDRNRFSLAYYNAGTSSEMPMVSIVVGVCDSETNLLTLNPLYCEEATELMVTTKSTTATTSTNRKNVDESKAKVGAVSINVIIGVVISYSESLLLLAVITITCGATELKKVLK